MSERRGLPSLEIMLAAGLDEIGLKQAWDDADMIEALRRIVSLQAEVERLGGLLEHSPWYPGMMPNEYWCVYCKGHDRFTMNPGPSMKHGHKDDCLFLSLLSKEPHAT